jgi:zinc protease
MKFKSIVLSALFMLVVTSFLATAQKSALNEKVPVDPDLKIGTLKNGITYYIKKNQKPENRAELRLVVNAGSMQENEDQQGLAHFLEHMCFNGTKNFKKSELIDFLEKSGVKFGQHLNAYTSFDETVYMLQLPTDKPELFNKGLLVLEDWAHNVALEDEEIEKERGVIIEEWRLGLGANERMRQKYFPVLLKGSRYAERLPIGKKEVVEKCDPQLLRDFYKDWYRPDLMAVVVVGDVDVAEVEKKIISHFDKIPVAKNPRERKEYDIPDNDEPLVCVASDKENTYTVIQMFIKHPNSDPTTVQAYKNSIKAQLYSGMLNTRITEISQKPDAPFLFASSSYGGFLGRSKSSYSSFAVPKENKINEALEVLLAENEKVKQFGFTQSEFDREKKSILARFEKMANEANKIESRSFAREYVSNFLEKEPIPGIKKENEYVKEFIPEITLEEVNALAKKWITDKNMALLVLVKEAEGIKIPTEKELLDIVKASKTKKYEAYVDEANDEPLMAAKPKAGKAISKLENKDFGITEITFANNIKVILKPTDFKNDEILFTAFAPGGKSVFPDNELIAASYMTNVINQSGFGNFDNIALTKKLAGNTAKLRLTMGDLEQGLSGSSTPKDFETLLQMNYQYFTSARKDDEAFKTFVSGLENQIKFMSASPEMAFYDKVVKVTSSNNPRVFIFPEVEKLKALTVDDVYNVYEKAYKNASDYTFVIAGNIDIDKTLPMLETYIGGLPTTTEKRNWVERKIDFPKGVTEETVLKGKEDKSSVAMVFNGKTKWSDKDYLTAKLLMKTLSIKLRESMREEQGGVYGVRSSISIDKLPQTEYDINVSWGCSPANVDKLVNTVLGEMKKIVDNGPTDTDIEKAKETFVNERETQVKENDFWLSYIKGRTFNGDNLLSFEDYKAIIKSITKKDLQKAAKSYFTPKHYVKVVLKPEEK